MAATVSQLRPVVISPVTDRTPPAEYSELIEIEKRVPVSLIGNEYQMDHVKIRFVGNPQGGDIPVRVQITNLTNNHVLYKIKASHHLAFRVQPASVGFLFPQSHPSGNSVVLVLTLLAGKMQSADFNDLKFLLQTCNVDSQYCALEPHSLWENDHESKRHSLMGTRIGIVVEESDDPEILKNNNTVQIFLEENADLKEFPSQYVSEILRTTEPSVGVQEEKLSSTDLSQYLPLVAGFILALLAVLVMSWMSQTHIPPVPVPVVVAREPTLLEWLFGRVPEAPAPVITPDPTFLQKMRASIGI